MSWQWESEPFRVFRNSSVDAQRATMGELYGILMRAITELAAREENAEISRLLRRQADLVDKMQPPRADRTPAKEKSHPWRQYPRKTQSAKDVFGKKDMPRRIHEGKPAKPSRAAQNRTPEVDKALERAEENPAEILDGATLPDFGDEVAVQPHDLKADREQIRDAIDDEMEKATKQAREQERFESDVIELAERGWK